MECWHGRLLANPAFSAPARAYHSTDVAHWAKEKHEDAIRTLPGAVVSPAKTAAERKADERQRKLDAGYALEQVWIAVGERDRMRKAGYVLRAIWVHPDGRQRMAKPIEGANPRRGKSKNIP